MSIDRGLTLNDYVAAFRRRFRLFLATSVIGTTAAVAVALLMSPVYESTAKILVESQQIPSDLARSTVTTTAAERLQLIEQRLMTRDNLLGLINRLNLYSDSPDMTVTDKVDKLRAATDIEMVAFDNNTQRRGEPVSVSTFTISYQCDDAALSAKVANEFVTMVIEQNLQSRNERAAETNNFFKKEVDRLASDLLDIEGQISTYKRANESSLPDSLEYRRASLATLDQRMFEREQRVAGLEESRRALAEALATGRDTVNDQQLSPDERQLQTLEQTYAQQRAVYAESHPTMRTLAARIKALRAIVNPGGENGGKSFRETEAERQIQLIDAQLGALSEQRVADEARKADLQKSIAKTPEVEMALSALERRHADLQAQYKEAALKQSEAQTGEKLEVNRQAERFEVIEQASEPEEPMAPKRMLIALGGSLGSIALGLALMVIAEMTSTAIRSPRDLERWLDLHPVVTVPYIRTQAERRQGRLRVAAVVLALLVVIPGGLYVVDQLYLPLPLIADKVMSTLGLDAVMRAFQERL